MYNYQSSKKENAESDTICECLQCKVSQVDHRFTCSLLASQWSLKELHELDLPSALASLNLGVSDSENSNKHWSAATKATTDFLEYGGKYVSNATVNSCDSALSKEYVLCN